MDEDTELRQMQEKGQMRQVQEGLLPPPHFPWPSSKPGPQATQPPPGQRSMPGRTEQMVEVGYNQETGIPATDDPRKWYPDETKVGALHFDQQGTAQEIEKKRRKEKKNLKRKGS
jgi:hypothetical protein